MQLVVNLQILGERSLTGYIEVYYFTRNGIFTIGLITCQDEGSIEEV